jgi:NADH dehydrogenase
MKTMRIAVLGGTGFVGHSLCARLAEAGHDVRILTRRRERHRDLLVLPTAQVVEADVHNPAVLRRELQGQDAVVNLVGILNEPGRAGQGFERAHVELPAMVVQACREAAVPRLLHMSALPASPTGPSDYLRSKGRGEQLVHVAGSGALHVTSFRPSVIFGPRDSFTNRFAALLRRVPWVFPLACPDALLQPVYVEDVVHALVAALDRHETFGQRYNLCGPQAYRLQEIVAYLARVTGLRRRILPLGRGLSYLQAALLQFAPGKPFTPDNYRSLSVASTCPAGFPPVFGITPARFEDIVPGYLGRSSR